MKEHPHAEVLRAIADGVPLSEFEAKTDIYKQFIPLRKCFATDEIADNQADGWITQPDRWQIRRKPKHIMVNGFKVPKPLDLMTPLVFWPYVTYETLWDSASYGNSEAKRAFERGCAHETQEAAIAHAKAMLGIDPEYFK